MNDAEKVKKIRELVSDGAQVSKVGGGDSKALKAIGRIDRIRDEASQMLGQVFTDDSWTALKDAGEVTGIVQAAIDIIDKIRVEALPFSSNVVTGGTEVGTDMKQG